MTEREEKANAMMQEIAKEMGITQSLVSRKLKKIRKEIENGYG